MSKLPHFNRQSADKEAQMVIILSYCLFRDVLQQEIYILAIAHMQG